MVNRVGASANMYYVPTGSASTGRGFFPPGPSAGVVLGSNTSLRDMLMKQIEYYFRQMFSPIWIAWVLQLIQNQ